MAGDVPARILIGVGEQGAGAGDILFGMDFVDFVLGLVALVGNREHPDAVDGRVGDAESGYGQAKVIPSEVHGIDNKTQSNQRGAEAS